MAAKARDCNGINRCLVQICIRFLFKWLFSKYEMNVDISLDCLRMCTIANSPCVARQQATSPHWQSGRGHVASVSQAPGVTDTSTLSSRLALVE